MPTLDETWRKSTRSHNEGACVEVRRHGPAVEVRDTKQGGAGPTLAFDPDQWITFVDGVKSGAFGR